ncbi:MAG: succinylglutamate desuccinylase/aspartoacylase family protein [Deltaproteobacteria bacterium]|nr:succinylglutamate desuccinylase/aspartoacylase family protein [Deltaproteobacteria bacterium]
MLLDLVEDGAGRPVRVPLLVLKGTRPGPVLGLTAALHGNEINGIPVIHGLFRWLADRPLRGAVVAALVVNVPGFHMNERRFAEGTDLNSIMPGVEFGNEPQVYAWRFLNTVVRHFDELIDLHTASTGRHNSLYVRSDMDQPRSAEMAQLLRPQIVLHNAAKDGTLRAAAEDMGIPAVTLEIGNPQRFQPEHIRLSLIGIRRVMGELGMVRRPHVVPGPPPVVCSGSRWLYTDRGGLLDVLPALTERVAAGDVVARLCDIFGDHVAEYRSPESGIVIGKSVNPVGPTGARILHLGIVAPGGDPQASGEPAT